MNRLVRIDPRSFGRGRQDWVPAVDIHEYADRFELYIDVPGVDPGKVDLTLEGGVLTLSGERSAAAFGTPSDRPQSTRTERELGHFYRQFVLPDTVDGEGVNAVGKDGILTVTIPKHAKAMPRRIQVAA